VTFPVDEAITDTVEEKLSPVDLEAIASVRSRRDAPSGSGTSWVSPNARGSTAACRASGEWHPIFPGISRQRTLLS
jgi:hypothetical protein